MKWRFWQTGQADDQADPAQVTPPNDSIIPGIGTVQAGQGPVAPIVGPPGFEPPAPTVSPGQADEANMPAHGAKNLTAHDILPPQPSMATADQAATKIPVTIADQPSVAAVASANEPQFNSGATTEAPASTAQTGQDFNVSGVSVVAPPKASLGGETLNMTAPGAAHAAKSTAQAAPAGASSTYDPDHGVDLGPATDTSSTQHPPFGGKIPIFVDNGDGTEGIRWVDASATGVGEPDPHPMSFEQAIANTPTVANAVVRDGPGPAANLKPEFDWAAYTKAYPQYAQGQGPDLHDTATLTNPGAASSDTPASDTPASDTNPLNTMTDPTGDTGHGHSQGG